MALLGGSNLWPSERVALWLSWMGSITALLGGGVELWPYWAGVIVALMGR